MTSRAHLEPLFLKFLIESFYRIFSAIFLVPHPHSQSTGRFGRLPIYSVLSLDNLEKYTIFGTEGT